MVITADTHAGAAIDTCREYLDPVQRAWLFGHPMGLVGLAINDAIVVLAALRADPGASRGEVRAGVDVVVGASRHILATTFTTMGGFLPLILFGGRFWFPMATVIAGGVAGASILALYFVPSVHAAIRRRDRRRAQAGTPEQPPVATPDGRRIPAPAA